MKLKVLAQAFILLGLVWLLPTMGCASFNPIKAVMGLFGGGDHKEATVMGAQNKGKITGVEKVADTAEAKGVINIGGTAQDIKSSTHVGGNQNNDSEVMKEYIRATAAKDAQVSVLQQQNAAKDREIQIGLMVLLLKAYLLLGWALRSLLRARDKDEARDDARLDKMLGKKEA